MRTTVLTALLSTLLLFGCGETEEKTPTACLEGPEAILYALRSAPGEVRFEDGTPLSDCLTRNQPADDLYEFGESALLIATELGEDAGRRGPDGAEAAVQVGYLVGALEKGAEDSEGIHATLVDRVAAAATNRLERAGGSAEAGFEAGREAGTDNG